MLLVVCRTAGNRYAIDARKVSEVLPRATLHRESGSPAWLAGLMIRRGQTIPVIDLAQAAGDPACAHRLSNRIVIVESDVEGVARRVGLLAESADLHDAACVSQTATRSVTPWGRLVVDEHGVLSLIEPSRLLSADRQSLLFPTVEEG